MQLQGSTYTHKISYSEDTLNAYRMILSSGKLLLDLFPKLYVNTLNF